MQDAEGKMKERLTPKALAIAGAFYFFSHNQ